MKENDCKNPVTFKEVLPSLSILYDDLYDVNLYIYKATKQLTIIDIRYYLKSSLDETYKKKVIIHPSMLHCKITHPPWLSDKNEKFDINWEHKTVYAKIRMFLLRLKLKR